MDRLGIINHLIEKSHYRKYLEIGVHTVRKSETYKDLVRGETIPGVLR